MQIEVEKLALIDEKVYQEVGSTLIDLGAEDLGENNTKTVFFHPSDARVKVQVNTSKNSAKIVWKSGGSLQAHSDREEVEFPFKPEDFEAAVELVSRFLPGVEYYSPRVQKRHDYVLDDVNVSVKHSDDFGYHIEFDVVVDSNSEVEQALEKIESVAKKLKVKILSAEEENEFMREMKSKAPR